MGTSTDFPTSYKDPLYAQLDAATEQKLGLPTGLLAAVRTRGERSDHDQVSEANARSVYQFVPSTRKAIVDKYGIDPLLSPQNASEAAGRLLKEGMDRNGGDPALAVAEYHGGTDRANWGPRTKAYVSRVMEGVTADPAALPDAGAMPDTSQPMAPGTSTFDRLSATMGKPSESAIANVYQAYKSGQMPAADAQQFEADVNAGHIMLPRGAALNAPAAGAAAAPGAAPAPAGPASNGVMLPDAVAQAYASGRMPVEDRIQLEQDIKSGAAQMPAGVEVHDTKAPGFLERMQEQITGAQRATPQTQALPDWAGMPELNSASMASFKAALGTMATGPQETVQIIKANFPGVQVAQDEKGNYLLTSSIDGKQYAIKPGLQVSDIPRIGGGIAAFTPAGRAESLAGMALGAGGTQAAIEGTQWATGGEFNPGEVASAALLAPVVPLGLRGLGAAADAVSPMLARLRGAPNPASALRAEVPAAGPGGPVAPANPGEARVAPGSPSPAPAPIPVAATASPSPGQSMIWRNADSDVPVRFKQIEPQAGADGRMYARVEANGQESFVPADELAPATAARPSVAPAPVADTAQALTATELAQTARKAADGGTGSEAAKADLAAAAAPDAKTVEAAKRLGIEDYLQPDHVTTNQAYRELAQAVKSIPGSEARQIEMDGLEKVGERANKLISEIGGTTDVSSLDAGVKKSLQATQAELDDRATKLYGQLRDAIPADTEAPAGNVLKFVQQRAQDVGGAENLSSMEKSILRKLTPKTSTVTETVPGNPLMPGQMTATKRAVEVVKQPTYTLLDDVRKDVGAAARMAGPFKDADTGLAKKLYSLISDDQAAVVGKLGMADTYNAARQAVAVRKGIEDDLVSLFGKQLDSSMVGDLSGAIRALPQGDSSKLVKLLAAVPEQMRQEVAASGVATAFRTAGTRGPIGFGTYEKWFDGLLRNKQAHAALMTNLPPAARKQLSDLYRVSKGISAASRERITTGRIQAVQEQFKAADSLAGKLYAAAKRGAVGAAAGTVATPILGPGVGAAIASALTKGAKPAADKAVDALIASPEFLAAARAAGTPTEKAAVRSFAYSKAFTHFLASLRRPHEMADRERWVLDAMQVANNMDREQPAALPGAMGRGQDKSPVRPSAR